MFVNETDWHLKSNFTETIVLMTMRPIIQVPQVTLSEVCQDTALLDGVT